MSDTPKTLVFPKGNYVYKKEKNAKSAHVVELEYSIRVNSR